VPALGTGVAAQSLKNNLSIVITKTYLSEEKI
jgi:hypothetical protein